MSLRSASSFCTRSLNCRFTLCPFVVVVMIMQSSNNACQAYSRSFLQVSKSGKKEARTRSCCLPCLRCTKCFGLCRVSDAPALRTWTPCVRSLWHTLRSERPIPSCRCSLGRQESRSASYLTLLSHPFPCSGYGEEQDCLSRRSASTTSHAHEASLCLLPSSSQL